MYIYIYTYAYFISYEVPSIVQGMSKGSKGIGNLNNYIQAWDLPIGQSPGIPSGLGVYRVFRAQGERSLLQNGLGFGDLVPKFH